MAIFPSGTDDEQSAAGNGAMQSTAHPAVLNLELIREGRSCISSWKLLRYRVVNIEGIYVRPFTPCRPDAAAGRPHCGARTTEVPAAGGKFGKIGSRFSVVSQENQVTGRAVQVGETASILIPDVAHLIQKL